MTIIFKAIVIFALPVTVYNTIKFNLSKWSVFESITFKKYVNIMNYNVAQYVIGLRFNSLHGGETNGGFISIFFHAVQ